MHHTIINSMWNDSIQDLCRIGGVALAKFISFSFYPYYNTHILYMYIYFSITYTYSCHLPVSSRSKHRFLYCLLATHKNILCKRRMKTMHIWIRWIYWLSGVLFSFRLFYILYQCFNISFIPICVLCM